jgi:hypothetical protein
MSRGVVHLKPVMRDHPQLGPVVSGDKLASREAAAYRAAAEGYETADTPDDGRYHPAWPGQGPGGGNPCPSCTPLALLDSFRRAYPLFASWQDALRARRRR